MTNVINYKQSKNKMLLNKIAPLIETDGSIMRFNNTSVSIEDFDLFLFLDSNPLFYQSVNAMELSDQDIFSIIRIHVLGKNRKKNIQDTEVKKEDRFQSFNKQEELSMLIPYAEFKNLLLSNKEYTEAEKEEVLLYFNFFNELEYYEDYLLPTLSSLLHNYCTFLENLELQETEEKPLSKKIKEACENYRKAIENKKVQRNNDINLVNNNKLVYKLPPDYLDSTGSSASVFILLLVIVAVVILAGITLSIIN